MFYEYFRDTMSDEEAIMEPKEEGEQEVGEEGEEVSTSSFPFVKKNNISIPRTKK